MISRRNLTRYGGAVGGVALAVAARLALDPVLGDGYPLMTLYFAVVATASLAGFGPTLVTLLLGTAVADLLFMAPRYSFGVFRTQDAISLGVFVALGLMTAALSRRADQSRRLAEEVAERKRMEEALREQDRRKDEFIATLAHELRNPLAPVRNAVQVLNLTDGDTPASRKAREILERQVGQMTRLVDDLLDVSRIRQGKIVVRRERIGLRSVVQMAVETCRPQIEAAGHALQVELPPYDLKLEGDPARLAQVVSNLLGNAAKYMDPGGSIRLSVDEENGQAVIRVRDRGVGIPADLLDRIFDPFVQVDRSLHRSQGGLGIGLALVRSLVEIQGGTVEARSDGLGKGSEFVVRMPLPTPPSPPASRPDPSSVSLPARRG